MVGRALAWAVAAIPAGLGVGIALRIKQLAINGLVGGLLGGLLGGMLFDPIDYLMSRPDGEAALPRALGFTVIGLMVGLFVGLVEQWTKTAWMLVRSGPLQGKQFIIHRAVTSVGSSPRTDLYLFKDSSIEPDHALLRIQGGRCQIEDQDTASGTFVNGARVVRQVLHSGDLVVIGTTVLEFSMRENA